MSPGPPRPTRVDQAIGVLNGFLGDHLDRQRNALAIGMTCAHGGGRLGPKLCVLVHGLACTEGIFAFPGSEPDAPVVSYGTKLRDDLGYTPFAVRYNTGLPVARNGEELAALLDELVAGYPVPVTEIVLIGHSMGGLVLRSACRVPSRWTALVSHAVYLGTPHEGADLERLAHVASGVLRAVPDPITRLVGRILDLRSRGVKDLRNGAAARGGDEDEPAWWLPTARHHVVAGTLHADPAHPVSRLLGDVLVRVPSDPAGPEVTVFPGVPHLALAHDADVYARIREWCDAG